MARQSRPRLPPAPDGDAKTMSNRKRMNPFRSQDRTNFPPLDEFFDEESSDTLSRGLSATDGNSSSISLDNNSPTSECNELNFSVDMSIGGKAEMALHRYQVQKYGIDGIHQHDQENQQQQQQRGDDGSGDSPEGSANISRLSEGDDWDRVMDDANNISNISFSSTAIAAAAAATTRLNHHVNNKVGCQTPSPDHSSDDGSTSFFDKSIVKSLMTPEKVRYKLSGDREHHGVTLTRGRVLDDSYLSEHSQERSTNVSSTAGSGFERMFHAAMRFNKDFEEQSENSFAAIPVAVDQQSSSSGKDDSKDKSGCSSISFSSNSSRKLQVQQQEAGSVDKSTQLQGLDFLNTTGGAASPIQGPNNNNKEMSSGSIALKGLDLIAASPIQKQDDLKSCCFGDNFSFHNRDHQSSPSFNCADKSEVTSLASPACFTPRVSPNGILAGTLQSGYQVNAKSSATVTDLQLLGLSPIDAAGTNTMLKSPTISAPFDERTATTAAVPFDECHTCNSSTVTKNVAKVQISPHLAEEYTKRTLFQESNQSPSLLSSSSELEVKMTHDSIELVQQKSLDQCCTQTTVKSEESYLDDVPTTSLSEEVSPFSYCRTFGSNAAFRINSNVIAGKLGDDCCGNGNKKKDGVVASENSATTIFPSGSNRRGVRLSRLSKLKELGLGHLCLQQSCVEKYDDTSF